jgi:hypothetical protein
MKLDEKDSTKILSDYIDEKVEEGALVNRIVLFADDNRDKTVQSIRIYYRSPEGEKKMLKLPASEKERSIIDSIAAGQSSPAYDSICLARENNLIFRFIQNEPVSKGRDLKGYDWAKIPDIFRKEDAYCMGTSRVPLYLMGISNCIVTYAIDFDENNEAFDRHYAGLYTVSSPDGINRSDIYNNPNYNFEYSCFEYASVKDQVYLAGYPIPVEPVREIP